MPDLNAASIETAMSMIAGTARSMGIVVGDKAKEGKEQCLEARTRRAPS